MEENFLLFTKSLTLDEAIITLKEKLLQKNQIDYQNTIYKNFFKEEVEEADYETIIPGLGYMLKIFIYSVYYRHLLYNKVDSTLLVNSKLLKIKLENYITNFENNISITQYINYVSDTLEEFGNNKSIGGSIESSTYLNTIIPYFIIGNETISYSTFADGYFSNDYSITFVGIFLYDKKISPHNDTITSALNFFNHDLDHLDSEIEILECYKKEFMKYKKFYLKNNFNTNSFKHRISSVIIFYNIHEHIIGFIVKKIKNVLKFYKEDDIFNNTNLNENNQDIIDIRYAINYIIKSYDFDNELYFKILPYFDDFDKNYNVIFYEMMKFFMEEE